MADMQASSTSEGGRHRRRAALRWRIARSFLLLIVVVVMIGLSGCLERMAYYPTRGTSPPPVGVEEVTFPTSDGLTLHGWFAPAQDSIERAPTILVIHGNAGNIASHFGFVEFFPKHGFNVFIFDYRGYGRSDRGRLHRDNLLEDSEAALEHLLKRDDVDSSRILLYAQSLGCAFGSHLMMNRPEIRAAIFVSPFTSWQDVAVSALGASGDPGALARFVSSILIRNGVDPIDAIPKIGEGRHILIVHGTGDEVVPFRHGRRVFDAAMEAGVDAQFREVPGGDHNALRWIDPSLDKDMVGFYREALSQD